MPLTPEIKALIHESIDAAVQTERSRCAQIAKEAYKDTVGMLGDIRPRELCERISERIRRGA